MAAAAASRGYVFAAEPRAVAAVRKKYREPTASADTPPFYGNIMSDPRVVRGRTAGVPVRAAAAGAAASGGAAGAAETGGAGEDVSSPRERVRAALPTLEDMHQHVRVLPKLHTPVPLHLYLEEQASAPLASEETTQTDAFVPAPPPAEYRPPKRGLDAATEVDTPLVFNFDREAAELVEVVASKVLEQALAEVRQETELANMAAQRRSLVEAASSQRAREEALAEAERLKQTERKQLLEAAQRHREELQRVQSKLMARQFARAYLSHLQYHTFAKLHRDTFFYDPVQRQIERDFVPSLLRDVDARVARNALARELLDDVLRVAHRRVGEAASEAEAESAARRASRQRAEEETRRRKMVIKLFIHSDILQDRPLGPLLLFGESTVRDVEGQVATWLAANVPDAPALSHVTFSVAGGAPLAKDTRLFEIGAERLGALQMALEAPPAAAAGEAGEEDE